MANVKTYGFRPIKMLGGGSVVNDRSRVLTNPSTGIFHGDAIISDANGDKLACATGTTAVESVAQGASYLDATLGRIERRHLPASTAYTSTTVDPYNASYVYHVADPVNVVFEISVDAAIAQTDLGLNYAITLNAGSTTTGYSKHELTATGRAVTSTIPIRVRDFVRGRPGNAVDLADAAVICQINGGFQSPALNTTGT